MRNVAENTTRKNYYPFLNPANAVPHLYVDGLTDIWPISAASIGAAVNTRLAIASPLSINLISYGGDGVPITVVATIASSQAVQGNFRLRFALLDNVVNYNAANGQTVWHNNFLDLAPDATGIDFDIAANQTQTFEVDFPWNVAYNMDNLLVCVFVQNDATREVVQSQLDEVGGGYICELTCDQPSIYGAPGAENNFAFHAANTGVFDDTYDITVQSNLPQGWSFSYLTPDGEFTGNSTIAMEAGDEFDGVMTIQSANVIGQSGSVVFTIASQEAPGLTQSLTFFVLNQAPLVIINNETTGQFSQYYTNAIDQAENAPDYGVWIKAAHPFDYTGFATNPPELIFWSNADREEFAPEDVTFLTDYVNDGGNLFISGSEVAVLLDGTELIGLMGTNYRGRFPTANQAYGQTGDLIGDGMNLVFSGGDGADNRGRPCYMQDAANGAANSFWLTPMNSRAIGIRNATPDYKTFVLGVPFETISTAANRNLLMARLLNFFAEGEPPLDELTLPLARNYFELISTCIVPEDLNAANVFGAVNALEIVYQVDGHIYIPQVINTIGDISITQGYQLFCSAVSEVTFIGTLIDPATEYTLVANRWNWLGYPFDHPVPVNVALAGIQNAIEIIGNDNGEIWIPPVVNTLGDMVPGEGYFAFVNTQVTFQFADGAMLAAGNDSEVWEIPEVEDAPNATGLPFTVLVNLSENLLAQQPVVVELYDGNLLVGKAAVLEDHDLTPITAWQASPDQGLKGFTAGHPIQAAFIRADGSEIAVTADAATYGEGAYATIDADLMALPEAFTVSNGYPNPFNPSINVPFAIPQAGEVIFTVGNILGQQVYQADGVYEAGRHQFVFDSAKTNCELVSGVYFLQVAFKGETIRQKVVLMK